MGKIAVLRGLVVCWILVVSGAGAPVVYGAGAAAPERTDARQASAETLELIQNGSFEMGAYAPDGTPENWERVQTSGTAVLTWEDGAAFLGSKSVKITADTPDDGRWVQTIPVEPFTNYMVSGYIKTEDVGHSPQVVDMGANLALLDMWAPWDYHSAPLFGTNDWTYAMFLFNSGDHTEAHIGARLGYYAGNTTGTAWFDDLRVTPLYASNPHPSWKILVLIYEHTDFTYTDDAGVTHHMTDTMTQEELEQSALAARKFVEEDIPALSSGNMVPTVTIRYPERTLSSLSRYGDGYMPYPEDTAPELDPAFDSVIVISDPELYDAALGRKAYIGGAGGLAHWRGTGQTYVSINVECTYVYGHRNFFKHEWGHSLLFYYGAAGTAPRPAVDNHMDVNTNPYVHCPTGEEYVFEDETLDNPIPNSIYNNESGYTHDYYSGTTARPWAPTVCLGITPAAWASGGPVSRPERPVIEAPGIAEQIEAVGEQVTALVDTGALAAKHAKNLHTRLNQALRAVDQGKDKTVVKSLQAFQKEVQSLIKKGRLVQQDGAPLIDAAQGIIDQL